MDKLLISLGRFLVMLGLYLAAFQVSARLKPHIKYPCAKQNVYVCLKQIHGKTSIGPRGVDRTALCKELRRIEPKARGLQCNRP